MSNIALNYRAIIRILAVITLIVGLSMLPALICSYIYNEPENYKSLLFSIVIALIPGITIFLTVKPVHAKFRAREGYLVVAFCWIIASIFGAFPYFLSNYTDSYIDAFFESVAGFTTTGCASIDVSIMSKALLLWKATSHWLGGMGILVFVISILPTLGINGQFIAKAETPGPVLEKMAVRMSDSAKILYLTYFSFTVIEFLLLCVSASMTPFDALINTMGSISTGGLFAHPDGVGYYNSLYVEIIIGVFTILASVNFVLYHYALTGKWTYVFNDIELKAFLRILALGVLICSLGLYFIGDYPSFGTALRDSFFQIVSVGTTSGYASADYTLWPTLCKTTMLAFFFIGGCGASTCGSIKVLRVLVLFKLVWRGFYKRIHPRSVVAVKIGGKAIPAPVVSAITVFILMYMALFLFSALILSLQNLDLETTLSAAASMLSNTGIAFGKIGASGNYSMFCAPLKLYLSLLMIIGRLELFTIIILFTKSFWGKDR